jgi:20S proteasome alpha/beta subunit
MTVCIGAICNDGRAAVVAADELVTFGPPMNLQTEPPVFSKITKLTNESVFLFSGNVPDGEQILVMSKATLGGVGKYSIDHVTEQVKVAYVTHKQSRVEETILRPLLGADFRGFQTLVSQSAGSQILQQVLMAISQHNLQTDILIAGFDENGHHLYIVTHPGIHQPHDTLGFTAIGSGALHAAVGLALRAQNKASALPDTVLNVYQAKKAAEVAPGVGKRTDMAILKDGKIRLSATKVFDILDGYVQKTTQTLTESDRNAIIKACDEHIT